MSDLFGPHRHPPPLGPLPPVPAPGPAQIPAPPAPPLPPQRYVNRATNALARFAQPFIGGNASRPPSSHENRGGERLSGRVAPAPLPRSSSPLTSQTATHRTGIAIAAVDVSPQKTHAVLAGREILKTIRVSGANCAEEFNLRAAIIAYSSTHNTTAGASSVKHKDDLAATDVKWSHGNYDSHIATACPNGRIMLYDINRAGVESARLDEHNRQVHKLAFNPHQGYLMLSASQDATIRLWDLRAMQGGRNVLTFRSAYKYKGNAEGIRDVKWSPTDGTGFACGTDAGVIQRWDFRKDKAPLQKINAHKKICLSIDWHPDGKHLASAGTDRQVQVWDLASSARRQNSPWSFRAPQTVTKVRWRPVGWNAGGPGPGKWETTQMVTSYGDKDPRIHLWDIRRPYVPFREIDRYNHAPTDMLWHSEDLLWTVGVEGMFTQTDIHFAPKVQDRQSLQAFDISSEGELTFFSRPRSRRPDMVFEDPAGGITISGSSREKGSSGERLSGSRSSTENEAVNSFLQASNRPNYGRTSSSKSSKSLGNTPPSDYTNVTVAQLNEILVKRATVDHGQLGACGRVLGSFNPDVFRFLVLGSHLARADRKLRRSNQIEWIGAAMEHNARCARAVGMFRLSQTWRILGHTAMADAWARAERRRENRLAEEAKRLRALEKSAAAAAATGESSAAKVKSQPTPRSSIPRSHSGDLHRNSIIESTSNLATPLAKPLPDSPRSYRNDSPVASISGEDSFILPPPQFKRSYTSEFNRRQSSVHNPSTSFDSSYDMEPGEADPRRVISNQRRPPLRLDTPSDRSVPTSQAPRGPRRRSSESFTMFSASTGAKSSFGTSSMGSDVAAASYGDRRDVRLGSPIREDAAFHALARHSTASSAATESTSHDTIAFSDEYSAYDEGMEASGTIIPDDHARDRSQLLSPPTFSRPTSFQGSRGRLPGEDPASTDFISTDFLPPSPTSTTNGAGPGNGTVSTTPWVSPSNLLSQTITYHLTTLSDHLTPALLLLLLSPLLPPDTDAASLPHELATSLLLTLHHQLISLSLFAPATHLRNICAQSHPDVSSFAKENVAVVFRCQGCGGRPATVSTRRIQKTSWLCDKCGYLQAPCPICCRRLGMGRWAWCQGCGHGGHAKCLEGWWAEEQSEGGCAVEGCLHDCVKGKRRDERERERVKVERERKGGISGGVRRDDWVAGESRAVRKVRGGLLSSRAASVDEGSRSHATGASSAAAKKVKLLTPSEQGL